MPYKFDIYSREVLATEADYTTVTVLLSGDISAESQTLSYIPSSYLLSILNGNTVNLSSINSLFGSVSGKYEQVYSNVQSNSANWQNTFLTVSALSASWEESADILPTVTNYLSTNNVRLSALTITNSFSGINSLTVTGNISSTGIIYAQSVGPIGLSAVQQTFVILTLNEASKLLTVNNPISSVIIIPADSTTNFANGSQVNISRIGAGTVTVSASPGVFLRSADNKKELRVQNSTATVIKLSANNWLLFGDIV